MLKNIFKRPLSRQPFDRFDALILVVGLGLYAALTLATITKFSVWFDEAFGAYLIRFDFWQIAAYTAADVHPPLYYWLLKLWSMVFGTGEFALRAMSVLFGAVAIAIGYLIARRWFTRKAAVLGIVFMALSPMLIRYGQEMRMYTLVAAIALGATYALLRATETRSRKWWVTYGVLVALGMWTHYFSALVWISHWLWRLWVTKQEQKKWKPTWRRFFSKPWLLTHVFAVGLFLPWMPALIHQTLTVQVNGFWIPPVTPMTIPNFLVNAMYYLEAHEAKSWLAVVFFAVLAAVATFAVRACRSLEKGKQQAFLLVGAVAFLPMIILAVLSMPPLRPTFIDRYLITSVVGVSLFAGIAIVAAKKAKRRWQVAASAFVIGAMLVGIGNVYQLGNYNKNTLSSNTTREAVQAAAQLGKTGQPLIADTPWLFYEAVFYTSDKHPVYFLDSSTKYEFGSLEMLRTNDMFKIKDIDSFAHKHPVVWYVSRNGAQELHPPQGTGWTKLQETVINDLVSGQPLYRIAQFRTN